MEPNDIPPVDAPPPVIAPSLVAAAPPSFGQKLKKIFGPLGVAIVVFFKYVLKLKFLLPFLKTSGSMAVCVWMYALAWGWKFALGFVLLIFVHECGHLLAARKLGLTVGAPVFIPFMGAFIALKEAPRNAWIEAEVGIGGPLLGAIGSVICAGIGLLTQNPLFTALAYTGFLLNLFNLTPVGFLDGGRIAVALSPWMWVVGFLIMLGLAFAHPNIVLIIILMMSVPRLISLFRKKTDEQRRYLEVAPGQRLQMAGMYFGLIAFLLVGMKLTYLPQ
jgi:Zn-dependent protease